MSNMWEISQRFWMKFVDDNDYGYEEYEAIHWINHDFLVILNPEAFDIDDYIENGIVNIRMFDYNSVLSDQKPKINTTQERVILKGNKKRA